MANKKSGSDSTSTKTPKINMAEEMKDINAGKKGGWTDKQRDSVARTFDKPGWVSTVHQSGMDTIPKKKRK